jgi:hypothetical protein
LACSFPLPWHLAILPSKQLQPPSIPTPSAQVSNTWICLFGLCRNALLWF